MNKNIISLLFIFTSIISLYSQSKKVEKLKADYFESVFLDFDNKIIPIIKWENKDTLKYHINGEFKFMSKKNWKKYLTEIENLIHIKIIETNDISESDIKIFYGELTDYFTAYNIKITQDVIGRDFDNWSSRKYNSKKQITSASCCIVTSKIRSTERGSFNLKKLFLQSLGLLGGLENENSLFNKNQTVRNTQLKRNDKRIIRIHYDNSIKAGMSKNEIKDVLNSLDLSTILKEKY